MVCAQSSRVHCAAKYLIFAKQQFGKISTTIKIMILVTKEPFTDAHYSINVQPKSMVTLIFESYYFFDCNI